MLRELFTLDEEDRRVYLLACGSFAYVWGFNAPDLWMTLAAYILGTILLRRFIRRMSE